MKLSRILLPAAGVAAGLFLVGCSASNSDTTAAAPTEGSFKVDYMDGQTTYNPALDDQGTFFAGGQEWPKNLKVALRMDDMQGWYCVTNGTIKDEVDQVLAMDVPITIGVIGNEISSSPTAINLLTEWGKNPNVELANHTWSHPAGGISGLTLEQQQAEIGQVQELVKSITGKAPTAFIPPENTYSANTLTAMKNLGMSTLSSECTWGDTPGFCGTPGSDVVAPNIAYDGIDMLPAGAVIDDWGNYALDASVDTSLYWASRQAANQGFAVFMFHPQQLSPGCTGTGNAAKMAVLKEVIETGKANGWEFYTFSDLATVVKGGVAPTPAPSPTATPTPSPTATPTPSPTATPTPVPGDGSVVVTVVTPSNGSGSVTVKNTGDQTLNGFTVTLSPFTGTVGSFWDGKVTTGGGKLIVEPTSWNKSVAPGATSTIGFQIAGDTNTPTSCTAEDGNGNTISCTIK